MLALPRDTWQLAQLSPPADCMSQDCARPAAGCRRLSEPAVTDRQGIGFGWLQNAWLLHVVRGPFASPEASCLSRGKIKLTI
jgi:hypothetical protein